MANYQYQYGGYPSYQNGYQNYQQPQIQPQVQNTGILYVEGDRGAEEFQMLPNTFAFLKSTDGKAVYFKQALANGNITCEKFVIGEMTPNIPISEQYITRAEFEEFVKSLKEKKNESNAKYTKSNARNTKLQGTDGTTGDN